MMDSYKANYTLQNNEPLPATVIFLKDKLSITLKNEQGEEKAVYWFYDKIIRENFLYPGKIMVRHEGYPPQTLDTDNREFAEKLEQSFKKTDRSLSRKFFSPGFITLMRVFLFIMALFAAVYFFLVPWLAVRMANQVSVSFEEKMGNEMYGALEKEFKVDERKTMLANEFFKELHVPTPYNIRITVVKDSIANAFAMPGGHIVVYDKLLKGMKGYEELAALLSHEFTHVHNKHTTKSLFRGLSSKVFLSIILGDVGVISSVVISHADNLKGLSYGRSLEKESDLNGLQILSERKIDCNGFIKLFELLQNEVNAAGVKQPAEWISSHPDLKKRMEYVKSDERFNLRGVEKNETLEALFMRLKIE